MGHVLECGTAEYKTLRDLDAKGTERLLQLRLISPLNTFMGRGSTYDSLLYYAIDYGWHEGIAMLMWYGADADEPERCREMTPLEYASSLARPHNRELAQMIDSRYVLALLGARRVNAPLYNISGETALMHAAENNHMYAVLLLVERYGARFDICDNWGVNALCYAMRLGIFSLLALSGDSILK